MANTSKLSKEERKRLQAILDQGYGEAFVNGSLAGGLGLGTLASIAPAVYGLTDYNPYRSDTGENGRAAYNLLNRQNTLGAGVGGFIVGAPIGGLLNSAKLMLQKRKARKLLGKTAAWQDYAINGGVGAAMGAGSGMAMNWALGRKLLDKRLILANMLAGGGIGSAVGRLKSQQHAAADASENTRKDFLQRDATGKVIRVSPKKMDNGEIKYVPDDNGLPLFTAGVYYIKEHDAGVKAQPPGATQAGRDTMGHDLVMVLSPEKLDPAKYWDKNGKAHLVSMFRLKNGQWAMTYELATSRSGPGGGMIEDRHGNSWPKISTTRLNGYIVGSNDWQKEPMSLESEDAYNNPGKYGAESIGADAIFDWANGKTDNLPNGFRVYKLTTDPKYNTPQNLKNVCQSLVSHAVQYDGKLTPWAFGGKYTNMLARLIGLKAYDPATCMEFAKHGVNGLASEGLIPKDFINDEYFPGWGAMLFAGPWENVGTKPYGEWENTLSIMARQQRGEPDPILKDDYYYEPYKYNLMDGFKWLKNSLTPSGMHTETTTDSD